MPWTPRRLRRGLLLGSLLLAVACQSPAPPPPDHASVASIDMIDSDAFDTQLRRAMADRTTRIVVRPLPQPRTDSIPPRLNTWLTAVAERGGQVIVVGPNSVDPSTGESTRSVAVVLELLNPLLERLFVVVQNRIQYAPASGYEVALVVVPGSANIQSVVFRRKAT
ncbi:hypothetical protein ACQW02_19445 [Humitalea sp. 24SJ18S-53]|uniref:hypothetical protein n=1 Tax=Humitalea sp. 24SJ18S-53 TaxID=3422307 RepID=UPI003D66EAD1